MFRSTCHPTRRSPARLHARQMGHLHAPRGENASIPTRPAIRRRAAAKFVYAQEQLLAARRHRRAQERPPWARAVGPLLPAPAAVAAAARGDARRRPSLQDETPLQRWTTRAALRAARVCSSPLRVVAPARIPHDWVCGNICGSRAWPPRAHRTRHARPTRRRHGSHSDGGSPSRDGLRALPQCSGRDRISRMGAASSSSGLRGAKSSNTASKRPPSTVGILS